MMKNIIIFGSITLTVIVIGAIIIELLNPLRRLEVEIKNSILALTPVNANMEEVTKVIKNDKWQILLVNNGDIFDKPYPRDTSDVELDIKKSIRVSIGEYRNIFETSVIVYWAFDENSKLIDIYVWKDTDAL